MPRSQPPTQRPGHNPGCEWGLVERWGRRKTASTLMLAVFGRRSSQPWPYWTVIPLNTFHVWFCISSTVIQKFTWPHSGGIYRVPMNQRTAWSINRHVWIWVAFRNRNRVALSQMQSRGFSETELISFKASTCTYTQTKNPAKSRTEERRHPNSALWTHSGKPHRTRSWEGHVEWPY